MGCCSSREHESGPNTISTTSSSKNPDDQSEPGDGRKPGEDTPRKTAKRKIRKKKPLDQSTLNFLEDEFKYRDRNNDGGIDKDELNEVLVGLGIILSPAAFQMALSPYGSEVASGKKNITLPEFIEILTPYMRTKPSDALTEEELVKLKTHFSKIDVDGSGTIDQKELQGLLAKTGRVLSDSDVRRILKKYDKDGSGTLDFDEFVYMVLFPE